MLNQLLILSQHALLVHAGVCSTHATVLDNLLAQLYWATLHSLPAYALFLTLTRCAGTSVVLLVLLRTVCLVACPALFIWFVVTDVIMDPTHCTAYYANYDYNWSYTCPYTGLRDALPYVQFGLVVLNVLVYVMAASWLHLNVS